MSLTVVDLFCGCGGLSRGFANAGFEVLAGFDAWRAALEVYAANNGHDARLHDLSDEDSTVEAVATYRPDVIAGGPPCQDFSSSGKREEGSRANLTVSYARIVARVRPRAFVMENVERARLSSAFAQAMDVFREAGYGLTQEVLDASLHGVPQKRKRVFVVGVLGGEEGALSQALRPSPDAKPMTVREYFGDSLGLEAYYRHPRSYARRAIYSVDEPSATIRGVNRPMPSTYVRHENDAACPSDPTVRALTTQERARIQTFPADYDWSVAKSASAVEQMVGNAVPVNLAAHVAGALRAHLEAEVGVAEAA